MSEIASVLVVSEDAVYANELRRALFLAGLQPIVARGAFEAFQMAPDAGVGAVIWDDHLSSWSGVAMAERLVGLHGREAPVMMVLGALDDPRRTVRDLGPRRIALHERSAPIESLVARILAALGRGGRGGTDGGVSDERRRYRDTDPLTGVQGHEQFARRMAAEWRVAHEQKEPMAVVAISPDRLDAVRERRGVRAASCILARAAVVLEGELRARDCVARYGDCFVAVLPETSMGSAVTLVERVLRVLGHTEFGRVDRPLSATFSAGLTAHPDGLLISPERLCERAEKARLEAVARGGARLAVAISSGRSYRLTDPGAAAA